MKGYDESSQIKQLGKSLRQLQSSILKKAEADISAKDLVADRLIEQIFESSEIVLITSQTLERHQCAQLSGIPGRTTR